MATAGERWRGTGGLQETQRAALAEAVSYMRNAYMEGPWALPPDEVDNRLRDLLREVDPWQIDALIDQTRWDIIGGYTGDTDAERRRAVQDSVRLYKYNPLAQWSIWLWTAWGLGDKLAVSVSGDDEANDVVTEFFAADRNAQMFGADRIDELSNWLLVRGNRFFCFFTSTMDGETRVRLIDQDEIAPIANPEDSTDVWFYKRTYQDAKNVAQVRFYPDYSTQFGKNADGEYDSAVADLRWKILEQVNLVSAQDTDKRADKAGEGKTELGNGEPVTMAYVMWTRHNVKDDKALWGWPLATCARTWTVAHQHYMESRLTLAEAASMYVRRKKVQAGSRGVKSVIDTIASRLSSTQYTDTNPPAVAGGVEVDNAMIDTTDLPLRTGAGDTAADAKSFVQLPLLGFGLFPTSAGWDTARFATALEMDKAQSAMFENYRAFWSAQFRRMTEIVLMAKERYGKLKPAERTIQISIDSFSLADFPAMVDAIGKMVGQTVTPLLQNFAVSPDVALKITARLWRVSLNALGIDDADEILSDEALKLLPASVGKKPEARDEMPTEGIEELAATLVANQMRQVQYMVEASLRQAWG